LGWDPGVYGFFLVIWKSNNAGFGMLYENGPFGELLKRYDFIRYADVLLFKAELSNWIVSAEALPIINRVRTKAGLVSRTKAAGASDVCHSP
jgi:hypothetical protein